MHIVIAGGRGLLGRALAARLREDGHRVSLLTRRAHAENEVAWEPADLPDLPPEGGSRIERQRGSHAWRAVVGGADAVVNLAGESIAGRRWTAARKTAILDSRLRATRALVEAMRAAPHPPTTFLSGSAVGIYGARGDEPLTEETAPGTDFLAQVCVAWEREAAAVAPITRLVLLRTGVVLSRDGGALPQMALPFHFFAGGPLGSGRQYVPWIHVDDWVAMTRWALLTPALTGPLNVTAPTPVTNRDLARALGRALHRPSLMPAPAFALRLALGEMASAVLDGQRVVPAKAQALGFTFGYPTIAEALGGLYA